MFTASCDIILGEAIGILVQFGVIGWIETGSTMMSGLRRWDRRGCGFVVWMGGKLPGVLALVFRMWVRGCCLRCLGSVGLVVVVTVGDCNR